MEFPEVLIIESVGRAEKKKHKNGRIVKDKDGYEVWEVVGTNTNYHGFGECDEVSIYIE